MLPVRCRQGLGETGPGPGHFTARRNAHYGTQNQAYGDSRVNPTGSIHLAGCVLLA
jgi:hypothetical protein